jgi:hypothetical protein
MDPYRTQYTSEQNAESRGLIIRQIWTEFSPSAEKWIDKTYIIFFKKKELRDRMLNFQYSDCRM